MKYVYYIAYDDGNLLIRNSKNTMLERYDKSKRQWIEDCELSRVYFGDMPVDIINEAEAIEFMEI